MLQNLPSHLAVKVALHALPMLVSFCKMGPSWSKTVLGSFSGIFIWQVQELHASLATSQSFGSGDDDDDDDDDDDVTSWEGFDRGIQTSRTSMHLMQSRVLTFKWHRKT